MTDDADDTADEGFSLVVPFPNDHPVYCFGVEFGMLYARLARKAKSVRGYYRTENEEQIRLTCHRLGYDLVAYPPWRFEGEETGWVYLAMRRKP